MGIKTYEIPFFLWRMNIQKSHAVFLGLTRAFHGWPRYDQANWAWNQPDIAGSGVIKPPINGVSMENDDGLVNVPFWGFVSHHLQISVGNYIPNTWVMWKIGTFTNPWMMVNCLLLCLVTRGFFAACMEHVFNRFHAVNWRPHISPFSPAMFGKTGINGSHQTSFRKTGYGNLA